MSSFLVTKLLSRPVSRDGQGKDFVTFVYYSTIGQLLYLVEIPVLGRLYDTASAAALQIDYQ